MIRSMVFCLFYLFTLPVLAQTQVHVFVDGPLSLPHYPKTQVTVFDMTASKRLLKTVPVFSANQATAKRQFANWIKTSEGQVFMEKIKKAHEATHAMSQLKVKKIPAIVIDKQYVVYGSTDVRQALQVYRAKQARGAQ